jgi:hypothetical protein
MDRGVYTVSGEYDTIQYPAPVSYRHLPWNVYVAKRCSSGGVAEPPMVILAMVESIG